MYVTVVVPKLKVCVPRLLIPDAGEFPVVAPVKAHVNVANEQLSVTTGAGVFTGESHVAEVVLAAIFAGQVPNTGARLSLIVTVNEQLLLFPAASVAT